MSKSTSSGTPQVSIAFSPALSSTSVPVGSTTGIQFTPVVSNDPSNSGVDWAITCPLSDCGTLSIPNGVLHSASGTAVTYLPPASFSTGSLVVHVTVFATADHAKNIMTPVTVTSYTSVLNGNYVLQVMGNDGNAYQATGVFTFDGNGNVTSGQETINSLTSGLASGFLSSAYTLEGASTPSTYFIGPDGRGTITVNLQQSNNGPRPPFAQTFTLVALSTSKALITELDGNPVTIWASGTLELQDSTAATTTPCAAITPPCTYAFVTNGTDGNTSNGPLSASGPAPTAIGGVINIDNKKPDSTPSPGSISGNGSLADQHYFDASAMPMLESCTAPAGVTGSVSLETGSPGVVTITLTGANCFGTWPNPAGTIQFTGYIVDATRIRLIESDDFNGQSGFLTAGIAVMQSAAATFTNASLSGSYVYGVLGYDMSSNSPPYTPSSFTSAGVIQTDGKGNLTTGSGDTLFASTSAAFTASGQANINSSTYSVDPTHIGRVELIPSFNGPSTLLPTILFYLTGNGTPPLVLWSGDDVNLPSVGAGIAYPQAANAAALSFGNPEKYGLGFTQYSTQGSTVSGSGEMTSTVTSVISGTLSGTVDDGTGGGTPPCTAVCFLDAFNPQADSFGGITGTFLNAVSSTPPSSVDYYLVNDNQGFFVETDLLSSSRVSLGNFAQACDVTSATSCQMAAATTTSSKRALTPRVRIKP